MILDTNGDREAIAKTAHNNAAANEQDTEIDLLELLHKLLESIRFIILLAIAGGVLMAVYSFFMATPMYSSTSRLYVVSSKDSVVDLSAMQLGSYLTSDYQEVLKTWEVHEQVRQNLGLDYTYSELENMMDVSNPSGTRIISIEVQSADRIKAANIANEYAVVSSEFISDTMLIDKPNIMSVALPADMPYSPNKTRNIIIGFALGALLAITIVTIRFVLNDKIMTADDMQKFVGITTLATVPLLGDDIPHTKKVDAKTNLAKKTMEA